LVRAAVVALAAAGGLAFTAGPALADEPTVTITNLPGAMNTGSQTQVQYNIKNTAGSPVLVHISFTDALNGVMSCPQPADCDYTKIVNDNDNLQATLAAGQVDPGQTKSGNVKIDVVVHLPGGDKNVSTSAPLTVNGPAQQQNVPEISGVVVDSSTGKPLPSAVVSVQDSGSPVGNWTIGSDALGKFRIVSTPDKPIRATGPISMVVKKDGYQDFQQAFPHPVAGTAITAVRVAMMPTNAPTTSVVTPSGGVTTGGAVGPTDTGDTTVSGTGGSGGGGLSWALIAIGGVLVALGIAAIVILLVRRKGDDDEETPHGPGGPGGGRGSGGPGGRRGPVRNPQPPPRRPEPTTVMRGGRPGGPGGPGARGGDQTMIARSPLADMPTQMHGRVPPQQGGPQGGPPPAGYGQNPYASGQYGGQQPTYGGGNAGYPGGSPPNYGQPDPYGNAYGPQQHQGGYGPQQGGGHGQGGQQGNDPRGNRPGDRRVDWLED
jgi:hypothetical protein